MRDRRRKNTLSMTTTIPKPMHLIAVRGFLAGGLLLLPACGATGPASEPALAPFTQSIGTTALEIRVVPISGSDGIDAFYMTEMEIDWDLFDAFVFDVDELPVKGTPEAQTRPTRPYMLVDRGFGHAGYPAISMSLRGAQSFCRWMTEQTGRTWRLPTRREWTHACTLGSVSRDRMEHHAWYEANAEWTTHPIGTKAADATGLYDLHGNVAEWVIDEQGNGIAMGGSFVSTLDELSCDSGQPDTKDWNESDPQIPRSIWWLADAPFIGFRIVTDAPH